MIFGGFSINHATARDNENFLRKKLTYVTVHSCTVEESYLTLDQQKAATKSNDELRRGSEHGRREQIKK